MKMKRTLSDQYVVVDSEIERFIAMVAEISGSGDFEHRGRLRSLMSLLITSLYGLDQKIKKLE